MLWQQPALLSAGKPDNATGRRGHDEDDAATHREWLRNRLLNAGAGSLADGEVLKMALCLGRPRSDPRPLARELEARFGSHAAAIAAPAQELLAVSGMSESGVRALKIVEAAARRLVKAATLYRPTLNHWDRLIEYLTAVLAGERGDQARALFLDQRNRLIADEVQAQGRIVRSPDYPLELMARAGASGDRAHSRRPPSGPRPGAHPRGSRDDT